MHRPPRGAGAIGERHYSTLFGEPPPPQKKGRTAKNIAGGHNLKQSPGTLPQNQDCGKEPVPPCLPE